MTNGLAQPRVRRHRVLSQIPYAGAPVRRASVRCAPVRPTSRRPRETTSMAAEQAGGAAPSKKTRQPDPDALVVNILCTNKRIYKEALDALYRENTFSLDLANAVPTLGALHQRSRRLIKHVELEIPTYTDIVERFSEVVRLSLRYCTGLKTLSIFIPFTLPGCESGANVSAAAKNNTTVYANGFDILRWLPQGCHVVLRGTKNPEIEAVVAKHLSLAKTQDKFAYARRQIIAHEAQVIAG